MLLIETCFILHLPHSSTEDYRWRQEDEKAEEVEEEWRREGDKKVEWRRQGDVEEGVKGWR